MQLFLSRSFISRSFIAALFFTLAANAQVQTEINFGTPAVGYRDFSSTDKVLFIEKTGVIHEVINGVLAAPEMLTEPLPPECVPNAEDAKNGRGFVLAGRYLVAPDRVCVINRSNRSASIQKLSGLDKPDGAFATMFLTEDQLFSYFAVIGGSLNAPGYLSLITIDKKAASAKVSDFVINIPDFSGALWRDSAHFYITLADGGPHSQNTLYQINIASLSLLIETSNGASQFTSSFKKVGQPFPGFSFTIAGVTSTEHFLYFNEGFESYFMNKNTGVTRTQKIAAGCIPYQFSSQWMQLCGGTRLLPLSVSK